MGLIFQTYMFIRDDAYMGLMRNANGIFGVLVKKVKVKTLYQKFYNQYIETLKKITFFYIKFINNFYF